MPSVFIAIFFLTFSTDRSKKAETGSDVGSVSSRTSDRNRRKNESNA